MRISTIQLPLLLLLTLFSQLLQAAPPVPAPPKIAASGYLLLDMNSGRVLAENNADARLEPASLTKIMTAYAVFRELREGNISLDDKVLVSEKAWKMPGSRMFIEVGKRVPVRELLKGMIIQSGNDASVALAEYIAGDEATFAKLMNQHAQRLGMDHSHFVNATGLPDPEHYTTPRDIAKVTAALIREFPDYYQLYHEKEFTYNGITQKNRNRLLWRDETVDGVKTGHTEAAGYCLVSSAKRDDMRLISVVMGTDSDQARARESQKLLNYGFRFFETHKLYPAGQPLTKARVWQGEKEQVDLGLAEDLFVTIPRRQYKSLKVRSEVTPRLMAPLAKGSKAGKLVVTLEGEPVAERPLVALQDDPEGGIWRQLTDSVLLWLE